MSMSPTFAWCLGAVLLWSFVFMLELFMSRMFPLAHFFCHSSGSSGSILYASSIPLDCVLCCADLLAPSPFPRPSIISAMVAGVVPVVLGMLLLFEKRGREVANTYIPRNDEIPTPLGLFVFVSTLKTEWLEDGIFSNLAIF